MCGRIEVGRGESKGVWEDGKVGQEEVGDDRKRQFRRGIQSSGRQGKDKKKNR